MQFSLNDFFAIQLLGFVGLGLLFLVFQVDDRKKMLRLQMWAMILFGVHFFLLRAPTGSALNFIGATRNYAFDRFHKHKWSKILLWIFVGIFSAATILTWQGPLSLLPAIGMISGTVAFWQASPRAVRIISLIGPPAWFIYNAISGSYPGMAADTVFFASNLAGIYRFDIRGRKKKPVKLY